MGLFLSHGRSSKLVILSILWDLLKLKFLPNLYPEKMLKIIFFNITRSNTPVLRVAGSKLPVQLEFSLLTNNLLRVYLCSHMWFCFPFGQLFHSDHDWLDSFSLLCCGQP